MESRRRLIAVQTILVVIGFIAAVAGVHRLLATSIRSEALRLVLALVVTQALMIAVMLIVLLLRRGVAERRARLSTTIVDAAHDAVAEHAAGADRLRALRALQRQSARDVTLAVSSFLANTRGTMHDRVATLARDLGITRETVERTAGEWLASTTLYERAVVADTLKGRAAAIASAEMPRIFLRGDDRECVAALDLLYAWRRAVSVPGFEHTLVHPSPDVRRRAFAVLPYVTQSGNPAIEQGLRDPDARVRASAAQAAGLLRRESLLQPLTLAMRDDVPDVVTACAFAVARIPGGTSLLQDLVLDSDRRVAAAALEAVEKASMERLP